MRIPRIFHPEIIANFNALALSEDAANHVGRVLRMQVGQQLVLFDGSNHVFLAEIIDSNKRSVTVSVLEKHEANHESPLDIHLGQVISRGEKMEFTIQKSVELGVNSITPLYSERCGVKLDVERAVKKQQQWQKIVIAACEQSGRNRIPMVHPITPLESWCKRTTAQLKLNLHPRAAQSVNQLVLPRVEHNENPSIDLLIGSEGGLTEAEIAMTVQQGFTEILLGPRVLRTETAALTAITALQIRFGDLG